MWLAIDTATDRASVALGGPGVATLEENVVGSRRHASQLLPMIELLLRSAHATLDDLRGVVLSDGPGSFTGLRVGATVAKALVRTRGMPLWIAPSLLVRAVGVASEGRVLAVADALRGELYAAVYRFGPAEIVTEVPASVWRPEDLIRDVVTPTVLVGEVPIGLRVRLEEWAGRSMVLPPAGAPHAAQLIDLVGRPGGAARVDDVEGWEPMYGRPAEAQVRWETTHGRPLPNSASGLG